MSVHRTIRLGEVLASIETGKSLKTHERPAGPGEIGILKLSAVSWGEFRPAENKAALVRDDIESCPAPRSGDLLMSRANTRELVGAAVIVPSDHAELRLSDKILRLNPDTARVERRYLLHALRTSSVRRQLESRAGGSSASMLNISQDAIRETQVPLPPLSEQRRIADILDRADALRAKRREAIALLDGMTEAVFVEMFGDPIVEKRWPRSRLGKLITSGPQNGLYKPASDYGSGTPIVRIDAFYDGTISDLRSLKRVRLDPLERERFALSAADIVINRVNSVEYLGKSAIIPHLDEPTVFESNMMRFSVDRKAMNPAFLIQFLQTSFIRRQIVTAAKHAVNQSSINQKDVTSFEVDVPPLGLQDEFVSRANCAEALKASHLASLTSLDALFASLQHRAFRGEL